MKQKYFISLFTALLVQLVLLGQVPPTLMFTPNKYFESPDGDVLENSKLDKSTSFWIVSSDRSDNKAFDTPDSLSASINTVGFMDKFYVTNETNDYLELYKYDENIRMEGAGKKNKLNPKKAKRVGWMKKDNLLLWARCLENKITHFSEKAITVYNEKNINKSSSLTKKDNVRIYSTPALQDENSNTVKMFQFLYVYKRAGASALIGKVYNSNVYRIERDVLGWVDEDILQKWVDRVCLEPNWDADAALQRKSAGIRASLFSEKEYATSWRDGIGQPKPIWSQDPYDQAWAGSKLRLPIFSSEKDLVYTGFATNLFNENDNNVVATVDQVAKMTKNTNEGLKDNRQINIVFVIDAGYGMKTYSSAIVSSLNTLMRKRDEMNNGGEKRNTYKYGAVVYRGMDDKNCPDGDLSISKASITVNGQLVTHFLEEEFKKEGCSTNELNRDVNKAMTEALQMIRNANSNSFQSNYILFLGGATGNTEPDLKTIPELIAYYDVNLSVFQLHCAMPVEFENFSTNFIEIIKAASNKKFQRKDRNNQFNIKEPHFRSISLGDGSQNLFRLDYPTFSSIQGTISFPEKGLSIPPETIDNVLDTSFSYFERSIENMVTSVNTLVTGMGERKMDLINADVKNFLLKVGVKMNDVDLASKFNGKNYQFFIPGWTASSVKRLDQPVFKHVIYVNEEELSDIIKKFEDVQ
ncbi:MAG: type VI secretion system protein TssR domain-containing protein, partial [Ferruginibacter sp.]